MKKIIFLAVFAIFSSVVYAQKKEVSYPSDMFTINDANLTKPIKTKGKNAGKFSFKTAVTSELSSDYKMADGSTMTWRIYFDPSSKTVSMMGLDHSGSSSDSFKNLNKWKNYQQLVKNYTLYIYKRPNFEIINSTNATIVELQAPLLDISSTHIRKLIAEKKSIRFLVPDAVEKEIEANNYYR